MEPGSRVFFPLAKLFVEFGRFEDAARTLRQGLDRHPDSMEARLLLIQVLTRLERLDEASEQLSLIVKPLERYPAFWTLWAREVGATDRDFSAFLLLVASHFSDKPVSWSDVVMEGLHSITARLMDALPKAAAKPARQPAQAAAIQPTAPAPEPPTAPAIDPSVEPTVEPVAASRSVQAAPAASPQPTAPVQTATPVAPRACPDEASETPYEGPAPEPGTFRTRTMAELLATQGDFAGALAIFRQLWDNTPGDADRTELTGRIKTLEAELAAAPPPSADPSAPPPAEADPFGKHAKNRLMSTLEALAARLEARVQA